MKLKKCESNPILSPKEDSYWESLGVMNPAVCCYQGKFVMLYRAAGHDIEHVIRLGKAESDDGIHFTRCSDQPFFAPKPYEPDAGCVEDPRLVQMGDCYYMTYASRPYSPGQYWKKDAKPLYTPPEVCPALVTTNNTVTHLAYTNDFISFKKLGRITDTRLDNRDVVLFPEQVKEKFVLLTRPLEWAGEKYGCDGPSMWISFSDDMLEWREESFLLAKAEQPWESKKIGAASPPIRTEKGWFLLYHGVEKETGIYRVGAMLLDLENPRRILARTVRPVMEPEYEYETSGFYNGCVFPTATVLKEDVLYIYYGSGDKYCCLATCEFSGMIQYLDEQCRCE